MGEVNKELISSTPDQGATCTAAAQKSFSLFFLPVTLLLHERFPHSETTGLVYPILLQNAQDLTLFQTKMTEETVTATRVSKREGGRQREQEPITHGVSSPIWSDRQSAEGRQQRLVRPKVLLNQFPRAGSSS